MSRPESRDLTTTYKCSECGELIPVSESQKHECEGLKSIREELERIFGKYQVAYRTTILPANQSQVEEGQEKYQ